MRIKEIYTKYKTPTNLQEHMLRAGALAAIILDHWIGKSLDQKSIVQTCLLHDIAKPMTFNLSEQPRFGASTLELKNLKKLQKDLKEKYGKNEYRASLEICREVGCKPKVIKLLETLEWDYIAPLLKKNNMEALIPYYCDMRIGPQGILSLQARLDDLHQRRNLKDYDQRRQNGIILEQKIKENVDFDLVLITDNQLNARFHKLLNIEI